MARIRRLIFLQRNALLGALSGALSGALLGALLGALFDAHWCSPWWFRWCPQVLSEAHTLHTHIPDYHALLGLLSELKNTTQINGKACYREIICVTISVECGVVYISPPALLTLHVLIVVGVVFNQREAALRVWCAGFRLYFLMQLLKRAEQTLNAS